MSPLSTSCRKVSTGFSVSTATRLARRLEVKAAESRAPQGSHRNKSERPWRLRSHRWLHRGETPSLIFSRGVKVIFMACSSRKRNEKLVVVQVYWPNTWYRVTGSFDVRLSIYMAAATVSSATRV